MHRAEAGKDETTSNVFMTAAEYIEKYGDQKKKSKYKNETARYGDRIYHSRKEARYAAQLDWRMKAGEVREWKPQYKIDIRLKGVHICNYYIDFKVWLSDGSIELVEVKGPQTEVWRLKWRLTKALIEELEPGCRLVLVR